MEEIIKQAIILTIIPCIGVGIFLILIAIASRIMYPPKK